MNPRVTAVVVAFGDEPLLEPGIRAVLASTDVDVDVVLVDNGCTDDGVRAAGKLPGVTVLEPGENLGFAGGCDLGAGVATGEYLALINPDTRTEPTALAALARAASDPTVGVATASIRLYDRPAHMNSAGNEMHYLGFSWCGALDEPASNYTEPRDVPCASGAAMMLRRSTWEALGGFVPEYFAYYEDSELSLRCWQRGLRVVFVPDAVVLHRYEFDLDSQPQKFYLAERNRLISLCTLLEARTLALIALPLIGVETMLFLVSATNGWAPAKLRAWWWIVRNLSWVRTRRAQVQRERTRSDAELAPRFQGSLSSGPRAMGAGLSALDTLLAAYWNLVKPRLG